MRIGLISDTHIPEAMPELWPHAYAVFDGCDAILHAGDIYDLSVIDGLSAMAPTYAARGNDSRDSATQQPPSINPRPGRNGRRIAPPEWRRPDCSSGSGRNAGAASDSASVVECLKGRRWSFSERLR